MHEGSLIITGSIATKLEFWHADGTSYGAVPLAPLAELQTKAFQALRGLGFRECDAKQALAQTLPKVSTGTRVEHLVRHCLALLTARAYSHG